MKRIVLTYGLIAGAVLGGMMLISTAFAEQIGFDRGAIIGYTSMVAAFVMIYFGVRTYRDQVLGGTIGFWAATKAGLLIMLVASTCYVATWQFVFYRMMPDFGDRYMAYELEKARAGGASEASLQAKERELKEFYRMYKENPLINISFTYLEPLPVGLLITLASAYGLSRKRRAPLAAPGTLASSP